MSQPSENRPTYPPFDPPPGQPTPVPPPAPGPVGPFPDQAPKRPRWGPRLIVVVLIALLVAPCAAVLAPREIAHWYLASAQELRSSGQKDEAYNRLAEAIRWSPKHAGLLLQRAAWRLEDSQAEKALEDANQAAELARDNFTVLYLRSQILQQLDRHAEAIQDWKAIDRLSLTRGTPSRAMALNGLAYARAVGRLELDEALKNVAEALELEPKSAAILDTRGYLRHLNGENEKAIVDMDAAVKGVEEEFSAIDNPRPERGRSVLSSDIDLTGLNKPEQGVAVIHYHRALVLKTLGREKDAKKDLQRARELIGHEPDETLF
ncbi:MAG TPA: hypothetical protein VFV87_12860 [Pirellulaceae bacterium]|nr:hypothetical protein [Pirellulaceae bacterium]